MSTTQLTDEQRKVAEEVAAHVRASEAPRLEKFRKDLSTYIDAARALVTAMAGPATYLVNPDPSRRDCEGVAFRVGPVCETFVKAAKVAQVVTSWALTVSKADNSVKGGKPWVLMHVHRSPGMEPYGAFVRQVDGGYAAFLFVDGWYYWRPKDPESGANKVATLEHWDWTLENSKEFFATGITKEYIARLLSREFDLGPSEPSPVRLLSGDELMAYRHAALKDEVDLDADDYALADESEVQA